MIFFIIVIIHFKALASSILEAFSEKSAAASLLLEVRFSLCSFPSIAEVEEPLETFDKNHEMKGSHILTIFAIWAGLCLPGNIVTFYFLLACEACLDVTQLWPRVSLLLLIPAIQTVTLPLPERSVMSCKPV